MTQLLKKIAKNALEDVALLSLAVCMGLSTLVSEEALSQEPSSLEPSDVALTRAAHVIRGGGVHDFNGAKIRCESPDVVGIRVESDTATVVSNAVIENCRVGIFVKGDGRVVVEGNRIRNARVGIFLGGEYGIVSRNVMGGQEYCMVVAGNHYQITENTASYCKQVGILVVDDWNVLEGNIVRGNRIGIELAVQVPLSKGKALRSLVDEPIRNTLRFNTVLDNSRFDLYDWSPLCDDNLWQDNVFETSNVDCVD